MNLKISAVRAAAAAVKFSIIFILGVFDHAELVIDYGIILAYSGLLSIIVSADLYYYFFKIRSYENEVDLRHFYIISILSIAFIAPLWIIKTGEAFYLLPIFIFSEILCIELQRYFNVIRGTKFSANFILTRSIISLLFVVALMSFAQISTSSLIAALLVGNLISVLMFINKNIKVTNARIIFPIAFIITAVKGSIVFLIGSATSRFVLLGDRLAIDYIIPTDVALEQYINTVVIASMIGIIFEIFIGQFLIRTIFKETNIPLCSQDFLKIKQLILYFSFIILLTSIPIFYAMRYLSIIVSELWIFMLVIIIQLVALGLGVTQQLLYRLGKSLHRHILVTSIVLLLGTAASYSSLILHHKIYICLMVVISLSLATIVFRLYRIETCLREKNEVS